ncbi:PTS system nitrogen regulatory IIA component [Neorhizobium sp. 2083]|uniref:PTS sugar transporter subunit IIA n=1 Tax=Neorhizobium sp. 2083 TaxID=2817762 RepID=UPI000DE13E4D|nr:PTS sugar transporter subunit IIA [Neorhizobium sp. 2083]MDR6815719.1 PTS system nitrogen regulatory IIA component [Neorhizobium sp. 2083]
MKLGDYLPPENIVLDLAPPSKVILIRQLAALAAERLAVDANEIVRVLTNRETLGSTGIGAGIAIPHATVKGLDRHFCLFARLAKPVDFEAVDDEPVDLVFLLLNPENRPNHLNILSCIARRVREEDVAAAIRRATGVQDVHSRLCLVNP